MKRFLLIVVILIILVIAAVAIFIATFDANRFRPQVTTALEKALGRPVSIENLSLGWQGGIALEANGITVQESSADKGEPLLKLDAVTALVRFGPLLQKKLEVASVVLRQPAVHVIRDARGQLNAVGLSAAAAPAAASQPPPAESAVVAFQVDSVRVDNGTLHFTDATTTPVTELWIKSMDVTVTDIAPGKPLQIELHGSIGQTTKQNLYLKVQVTPPISTQQPGRAKITTLKLDGIPLESVLPASQPGSPSFRGNLTTQLEAEIPTLDPNQLLSVLSANGSLQFSEPVLVNLNVLREVFAKLSMLPGIVETLKAHLPPEYQQKFDAKDTRLSDFSLGVLIKNGALHLEQVQVETDSFAITGSGRVHFDQTLNLSGTLRVDPELSNAIIRSVNELEALTDNQGRLEFPLTIQGKMPKIGVSPDLQAIGTKLLTTKAQDLLGDLLRKALEKDEPAETPQAP